MISSALGQAVTPKAEPKKLFKASSPAASSSRHFPGREALEGSRPSVFESWLSKNITDAYSHTASPSISIPQKPEALPPSNTLSDVEKRASQQRTRSRSFQDGQDESEHGYVRLVNAIAPSYPPPSPANIEPGTTTSLQHPSTNHEPPTRMEADTLRESQHNIIARSLSIAKQLGDDNLESTDLSTSAEGPKLDTSARNFPKDSTDENDVIRNRPASLHS